MRQKVAEFQGEMDEYTQKSDNFSTCIRNAPIEQAKVNKDVLKPSTASGKWL